MIAAAHSIAGPTILAQISDLHLTAGKHRVCGLVDTGAMLERAVAFLNGLRPRPEAVILTGDLAERASIDEYRRLRVLLQGLSSPFFLLPGNHDDLGRLRSEFAEHAYLQPVAGDVRCEPHALYAVTVGMLRLVALDTVVPRQSHGALCEARLAWLDRTLSESPSTPTIVAMHHPPFLCGIRPMDEMGLREGAAELESLLRRHPQVERVICGHLHRASVRRFGGTVVASAPSTAHQIHLNLEAGADLRFVLEPPGVALHAWVDGALVTHFTPSGDHGPTRPFS